jgi:hypothetical protein
LDAASKPPSGPSFRDFAGGNVIEQRPQKAEPDTVWRRLRGAAMRLAARLI